MAAKSKKKLTEAELPEGATVKPGRLLTPAELRRLAASAPKDEKMSKVEGVVARGHTVQDDEGLKRPGQVVRASKPEIEKLRRLGYLTDPDRKIAPLGTGPRFYKEDEASKGDPN